MNSRKRNHLSSKPTLAERAQSFMDRHPELALLSPLTEVFTRCSTCGFMFDAAEGFGPYCSANCQNRSISNHHISSTAKWEGNYGNS